MILFPIIIMLGIGVLIKAFLVPDSPSQSPLTYFDNGCKITSNRKKTKARVEPLNTKK